MKPENLTIGLIILRGLSPNQFRYIYLSNILIFMKIISLSIGLSILFSLSGFKEKKNIYIRSKVDIFLSSNVGFHSISNTLQLQLSWQNVAYQCSK